MVSFLLRWAAPASYADGLGGGGPLELPVGVAPEVQAQQPLVDGGGRDVDVLAAVGEDQAERHPGVEECVYRALVGRRAAGPGCGLAGEGGGCVRLVEEAEDGQLERV